MATSTDKSHPSNAELGLALAALVIAGVAGFWATRPTTTDLATGDEAVAVESAEGQSSDDNRAVADDSAPTIAQSDSPNQIQRRLEATPRWFVASLTGSPDKPSNEIVVFADDRLILDNCDANLFDLEWKQDGFSVVGPSPIDLTAEVPTPSCSRPAGSQLAASMPAGLSVTAEANANGTISLNSNEWELVLTANPTASETLIYVSLLLEEASARAEERGLKWRIANLDGEPLRLTDDLVPGRLNFTVEDGIVIHVRTDDQLGTPDAPQVTTTTVFASPSLRLECTGRSSSSIVDFVLPLTSGAASAEDAVELFKQGSDWQSRHDWQALTLDMIRGNVAGATAVFTDTDGKTYLVLSARPMDGLWVIDGVQSCEP